MFMEKQDKQAQVYNHIVLREPREDRVLHLPCLIASIRFFNNLKDTTINHKLIIFDLDGTLVEAFTQTFLPGRLETLHDLHQQGVKLAIATNQGGVGLRYWMETDAWGQPEKYPTDLDVMLRLKAIQRKLGVPVSVRVCFFYENKARKHGPIPPNGAHDRKWDAEYRKPRPGM